MMHLIAQYPTDELIFWWVAVGVGFVVVLVVILLLTFLLRLVKSIDAGVVDVRDTLSRITRNTSNTPLIPETADGVDAVLDEGLKHHLFLTRQLTGAGRPVGGNKETP